MCYSDVSRAIRHRSLSVPEDSVALRKLIMVPKNNPTAPVRSGVPLVRARQRVGALVLTTVSLHFIKQSLQIWLQEQSAVHQDRMNLRRIPNVIKGIGIEDNQLGEFAD